MNDRDLHEYVEERSLSTNLQLGLEAAQTAAALYGLHKLSGGGQEEAPQAPPPQEQPPAPPPQTAQRGAPPAEQ